MGTNEKLAAAIRQGRRELMETLWERVEPFTRQAANRLTVPGAESDDLYQSGYLALVAAVDTYDPERGASFIHWYALALKTAFAEAGGYRTKRQAKDPVRYAGSLDTPMTDEPDADTLEAAIADKAAEEAFEEAEEAIWRRQLHDALETEIGKLTPRQAAVIRDFYWKNRTLAEIGRECGVSATRAGQLKQEGLSRMARTAALRQFVDERTPYFLRVGVQSFQRTGESATERAVFARERIAHHF